MTTRAESPLARLVFALLVVASFGAFFLTQRLKHTPTAVQRVMMTPFFSPATSGVHQVERVSFRIKSSDYVTVTVLDSTGDEIATLAQNRYLRRYTQLSLTWSGRTESGRRAPDGEYRVRVRLRNQGRSVVSPRVFRLDTVPPRPRVTSIVPATGSASGSGPPVLPLPGGGGVRITFTPDAGGNPNDTDGGREPQLFLYRTDVSPARLVRQLPIAPGTTTASWDGTIGGRPAPAGTYLVAVQSRDRAGNVGSDPTTLPPVPTNPPAGRAGITVRYLGVQPPSVPAQQRAPIAFGIDARQLPYRWSIARVGASHGRAGGTGRKAILGLQAPGGISGLYWLGVSSGAYSEAVPFTVQDTIHQKVLVVVPMISWLGTDTADEDADGLPDTLTSGAAVPRERIFTAAPPDVATQVAPVLAFLDRNHLRYDITTDLALAASPQALLTGHSGVLLPGDERWITTSLAQALRAYVSSGGVLASLGTSTMRGQVTLSGAQLTHPTLPGDVDALGARMGALTSSASTITEFQDGAIQLFRGSDGRFAGYSSFEPVQSPGAGAQIVSSAVAPGGTPVIVAARLGRGLWIHTGLPAFASRLGTDYNTAGLMKRIWQVLSGA